MLVHLVLCHPDDILPTPTVAGAPLCWTREMLKEQLFGGHFEGNYTF